MYYYQHYYIPDLSLSLKYSLSNGRDRNHQLQWGIPSPNVIIAEASGASGIA